MWAKSREKKAMGKYHTRNFGMGHVEADLHYLTRAELRGRKRWLVFSAVLLGYLLVTGHLLVSSGASRNHMTLELLLLSSSSLFVLYHTQDMYVLNKIMLNQLSIGHTLPPPLLPHLPHLSPLPPQVTCTILGVLRFDATGPPYFEFNNDGSLRWPEGAQLSEVRLDSSLQAFSNQSLTVTGGDTQQVIMM